MSASPNLLLSCFCPAIYQSPVFPRLLLLKGPSPSCHSMWPQLLVLGPWILQALMTSQSAPVLRPEAYNSPVTIGRCHFAGFSSYTYILGSCYQKATLCQYAGSHGSKGALFWSGQIIGLGLTCYNQYRKINCETM